MKRHVILIGAPGSGKGTQASFLVKNHGYKHVSTGDLLRAEISKKSVLGLEVKAVMDKGELVSDEQVLKLLEANLNLEKNVYIFDGYPRNLAQAQSLGDRILKGSEFITIYFEIDTTGLVARLTNRRTCKDCGAIYNLLSQPMKVNGQCDNCGGKNILHRDDDKEDVIKNRMNVYNNAIQPVLDFYNSKSKLVRLSAESPIEELREKIVGIISN